jgi:hypothetical protein
MRGHGCDHFGRRRRKDGTQGFGTPNDERGGGDQAGNESCIHGTSLKSLVVSTSLLREGGLVN